CGESCSLELRRLARARDIPEDPGPRSGVEVVELRTDTALGRIDLLAPLHEPFADKETTAGERRHEPEPPQQAKVENPAEEQRNNPAAGDGQGHGAAVLLVERRCRLAHAVILAGRG